MAGERLSAALMLIVQMRRNLGDLSQGQVDILNRALILAERDEQRSSLLHELGSLLQAQGDLPGARAKLERVLEIEACVYGSRDHYSTAISEMSLGFLMLKQGDTSQAVDLLRHAYEVFRSQLGPEHPHTRPLAQLFAGSTNVVPDPVREATEQARVAASRGDLSAAIEVQEAAAARLRTTTRDDGDTFVQLSVILYNLTGYDGQAGRWEDAVAAFEEVVALDERTGHEDLASDRESLEHGRHMASITPEERSDLEAAVDESSRITDLADQVRDAAIAVLWGELDRETSIVQLGEMTERVAADEPADSPWAHLAAYLQAVIALMREQPLPLVRTAFAAHLAVIEAARHDRA